MATWSASPDVEPPLRETVPLEARQKADLVLCDRLQDSHGWGLQAVLISSLILMSFRLQLGPLPRSAAHHFLLWHMSVSFLEPHKLHIADYTLNVH